MPSNSNGNFAGKVAFVTGAASGIGRATALEFARNGAHVVVADISDQSNQYTVRMIETLGGQAMAVRCDVTRIEYVKAALDKTIEAFGRLDFAFNNAGVEQKMSAAAEVEEAEWGRVVDVCLRGVFLCLKHEIPLMLKLGGGAIVNNSSVSGLKGFRGHSAYVSAKHGLVGLTKTAALEYATHNIRINAVCPGVVDTPLMDRFCGGTPEGRKRMISLEPIGRMCQPEEIADAGTIVDARMPPPSHLGTPLSWVAAKRCSWKEPTSTGTMERIE